MNKKKIAIILTVSTAAGLAISAAGGIKGLMWHVGSVIGEVSEYARHVGACLIAMSAED